MFKTKPEKEFTVVPEGIAHFLEHKLFESEDGDAFELFAKTGATANAMTSFEKTSYLFSATSNFEESLKALLTFVQEPYFTAQTVEKEQGIIAQEIRMYEDDPGWRVFFNLLTLLYHNHPVRIDIAGTKDSIRKIDCDLLYHCYHTFYNLNNMAIAITGDFDPEKALQIVNDHLKVGEKVEVEVKMPEEPDTIVKRRNVQKLSVAVPLFHIGFKESPPSKKDTLRTEIKYELIVKAIAGRSSELYREMYEEGLINDTFGREVFAGKGYLAVIFSGESHDPDKVLQRIKAKISEYKVSGISDENFSRIRKAMYGAEIMSFNEVEQVADELITSYFSGNTIYDALTILQDLTCDEINALLRSSFDENRLAISIIEPIEES